MKLVSNWKSFWRWNSVQIMALTAALPVVWMEIPPDLKAMVPPDWRPWVVTAIALCGIIARLRDQTK